MYLLATKVFDRRTGLVAGLLYGLFPEHIGFSHYLWAEILLSFLAVLSVYFLFAFLEDPGDPRRLYGSALAAGFALITKEYILLLFIGYLGAIPFLRGRFHAGRVLIACILALLPAATYSVPMSLAFRRVIVISDGVMHSISYSEGIDAIDKFSANNVQSQWHEIWRTVRKRGEKEEARYFHDQLCNLWTPNSYLIVRLIHTPGDLAFRYGPITRLSVVLTWMTALVYMAIVIAGLAGL